MDRDAQSSSEMSQSQSGALLFLHADTNKRQPQVWEFGSGLLASFRICLTEIPPMSTESRRTLGSHVDPRTHMGTNNNPL